MQLLQRLLLLLVKRDSGPALDSNEAHAVARVAKGHGAVQSPGQRRGREVRERSTERHAVDAEGERARAAVQVHRDDVAAGVAAGSEW